MVAPPPSSPPAERPAPPPPAPVQYTQQQQQALMAQVQASPMEVQLGILRAVKEQALSDPNAIAHVMASGLAAHAAQPPVIDQPPAAHPLAGMAKLAVADMGATTAALANGTAQRGHAPDNAARDSGERGV